MRHNFHRCVVFMKPVCKQTIIKSPSQQTRLFTRYRRVTRVFLMPSVVSALTFQLDWAGKPTDINTLVCRGQCTSGSTSSVAHRSGDQPQTSDELIPGVGEIKLVLKKLQVTFGTWNQPSASHCWRSLWCTNTFFVLFFCCSDVITWSFFSGNNTRRIKMVTEAQLCRHILYRHHHTG